MNTYLVHLKIFYNYKKSFFPISGFDSKYTKSKRQQHTTHMFIIFYRLFLSYQNHILFLLRKNILLDIDMKIIFFVYFEYNEAIK